MYRQERHEIKVPILIVSVVQGVVGGVSDPLHQGGGRATGEGGTACGTQEWTGG